MHYSISPFSSLYPASYSVVPVPDHPLFPLTSATPSAKHRSLCCAGTDIHIFSHAWSYQLLDCFIISKRTTTDRLKLMQGSLNLKLSRKEAGNKSHYRGRKGEDSTSSSTTSLVAPLPWPEYFPAPQKPHIHHASLLSDHFQSLRCVNSPMQSPAIQLSCAPAHRASRVQDFPLNDPW